MMLGAAQRAEPAGSYRQAGAAPLTACGRTSGRGRPAPGSGDRVEQFQGIIGIVTILLFAWAVSEDRRAIRDPQMLRLLAVGFALLVWLAILFLQTEASGIIFDGLGVVVGALDRATAAGTSFVLGYLGGATPPFDLKAGGSAVVLAFRYLPLILVISALSALLFHWRILPTVVNGFSWLLRRALGVRGALGVSAAANVFVGMVEAPLLVRPYLSRMSRGELFAVMTVGMATVAGTVLELYGTILKPVVPGSLGHVLTASLLNVFSALMLAALMVPFTGEGTEGGLDDTDRAENAMEALARGVATGVTLLINVTAMLIALVALVALVNIVLGGLFDAGGQPLTLERILGWVLSPLAWIIGIPWSEAGTAGQLLATKVVLNELKAFIDMAMLESGALAERSRIILTYAMCGFANLGSLGIMVGGIRVLIPEGRVEVAALGLRAVVAGLLSTCLTAAVVSLMI